MKKTKLHTLIKRIIIGLIITLGVIILLPISLYIPPVQSLVKGIATYEASKITGWDISVGELHLSFPLRLQLSDVLILTAPRDTMLASRNLEADVAIMPLFKKKIEVSTAQLDKGLYRMYSKDSSMYLHAKLIKCKLLGGSVDLAKNEVKLSDGYLNGGDVTLLFDKNKEKPEPPDTTKSEPWRIVANKITLANVHYKMKMLPVIDEINATVEHGLLKNGIVDTGKNIVSADYVGIDGVDAVYYTPSQQFLASYKSVEPVDTTPSTGGDWVVTGKEVSLKRANGIYAMRGAKPVAGLDLNYLQGNNMAFEVRDFYNKGMSIKIPIQSISGWERCGVHIVDGSGTFEMDSTFMAARNFKASTLGSTFAANGMVEWGMFEKDVNSVAKLVAKASISPAEVRMLYPFTQSYVKLLPSMSNVQMNLNVDGSLKRMKVNKANIKVPKMLTAELSGVVNNVISERKRNGNIKIKGECYSLNTFKPVLLASTMRDEVNIPPMNMDGNINFSGASYNGTFALVTPSGNVKLNGAVNLNNEKFDTNLELSSFPINAFLPKAQLGNITSSINASGRGFNPLRKGEVLNADVELNSLEYNKKVYKDIKIIAQVDSGELNLTIDSKNKALELYSELKSSLLNDYYDYSMRTEFHDVDLQDMGFFDVPFTMHGNVSSSGTIDLKKKIYDCVLMVDTFAMTYNEIKLNTPLALGFLYSNLDSVRIGLQERDLNTDLYAHCSLDSLIGKSSRLSAEIGKQLKDHVLNFGDINSILPRFELFSKMGDDNLISDYLRQNKSGFRSLDFRMYKDSILRLNSRLLSLKLGSVTLDTIDVKAHQVGNNLNFLAHAGNRKGNLNQFASSNLSGYVGNNVISALFRQTNNKGDVGFNIGLNGLYVGDEYKINFFPDTPIIGFRPWILNKNNFVDFNPKIQYVNADLKLSNESGYISLFTENKTDSTSGALKLDVKGINLGEWLNLSPYSPQISGVFNADASLNKSTNGYSGEGKFTVADLLYNRSKVGNLGFNLNMDVDPKTGQNEAQASLMVNGRNALKIHGVLSDSISKSPNFGITLDRLPLTVVNPFIPNQIIVLGGYLNGEMSMKGKTSSPILNGNLVCDSTFLNIPMFGSKLRFDSSPITVDNNDVLFDNFGIRGSNKNPLAVNGKVNIQDFSNPLMNLSMRGNNLQLIDSKYHSHSQMFGKGFVNLNGTVRGPLNLLNIDANIVVLPQTDATYVLQSDVSTISSQQQLEGLVKFVSFNDTIAKDTVPIESGFAMNLNADVNVEQGSTLNINLSPDGKNKVQLFGNGNLIYKMNYLGDTRLLGRYTIDKGFVRYYPPLISEKYFTFTPGSYVAWTGDVMNPLLSLNATGNQVSTIITDGTNPTRVDFEITANVTNTVKNMDISFDLAAPNNSTIQSELQSMTASQRSTQAINLMLYNNYSGDNSTTASAPNTNMLYSVLSSQLNNIASKVVKGVDINFGINEYNMDSSGSSSTGMNYSYQISKSLFDNRFKMTVGGNYDTNLNANVDIAQNLFSNVSFEYNLNSSGNMTIKIYNKLTDVNIYQTQVNETGVAFILRRRLMSLKDLFNFRFLNKFQKNNTSTLLKREDLNEQKNN